jgi:hypothetical protein
MDIPSNPEYPSQTVGVNMVCLVTARESVFPSTDLPDSRRLLRAAAIFICENLRNLWFIFVD